MIPSQADRMTGPQTLAYGSETIDFSLSFSPRRRLTIAVEPNGSVIVKAPTEATLESVREQIQRRAGWIIRQRDAFAAFGPCMPPKKYVSGETHRCLGRQYRLRVTRGATPSVKLIGRYFEIITADKTDSMTIQRQLDGWYRRRATRVFDERLRHCLESSWFRSLGTPKATRRK